MFGDRIGVRWVLILLFLRAFKTAWSALCDTGLERIQRDTQLAQRDSQYVAQQESSWASHLTGSTIIGNNPWSIKAMATAMARSQHASAMHSSLVARDQALLNAVEDLRETIGGSESNFAGVQALLGETFQNATSAAFAAWDESFSNVLGQVPRVLRFVDPMLDAHDIELDHSKRYRTLSRDRVVGWF
ncbi:MAG: hypothetical protein J0M26_21445 [Planctomycetes bacterium]|nr:hypothetical protein [Planctomycetota bacterium]